ncbi:murein transglycosylase A [Mesorhizobium sp. ZMM04-5]|uniref:peptidoglycan lytic exotransglycosylase n=1 Tax=Mesorhizobium marinum TaxID=3228790 RepID=A0ABV3QYL1_9HYPH
MPLSPLFRPLSYDAVPGWADDDHLPALDAFRRSALRVLEKPYRSGALGVSFDGFEAAYRDSRETQFRDDAGARAFFERHFAPALIVPEPSGHGFVTGFYEPIVQASPVRTARFTVPLLSRPDDLDDVDDGNRPPGMDPSFAFARRTPAGLVEYFDRRAIEQGALAGRGLEIAWLESRVDAFFIHVQGAARLAMTDGSTRRVTYAAKTGHPFTAVGRVLADLGEIPLAEVTMQSIRAWLARNPRRVDEILWRNRSYIFFRDAAVADTELGPVAAAKVPLTEGRSIAVDRLLHTFGTPIFVDAPSLTAFGGQGFRRLMIAQDTGSAIVGPARGDLFAGSGDAAGEIAGVVRHAADFYVLLPRPLLEQQR